jgi:DNA-binding response OmpR family regulator
VSHAPTILIVEDDENLGVALSDNLVDEGYEVQLVRTGHDAMRAFSASEPALVLLDLMLPDTDGYAVCRNMRARGFRGMILMLTARTLEEDLVRGFAAGADDYVTKPYRLRELLARVAALLRRGSSRAGPEHRFAGFVLDSDARSLVDPDGEALDLTRTEFDLLEYLLRNPDRALTRDELLTEVWGDVNVDRRTVDNFVSTLKRKMRVETHARLRIATIRGVGYRLELATD